MPNRLKPKIIVMWPEGNGEQWEDYREEVKHLVLNDNKKGRAEAVKLADAHPSALVVRGWICPVTLHHTTIDFTGGDNE